VPVSYTGALPDPFRDGREIIVDVEPVVLDVDAARVERIVENLVLNALRHTDDDTPVWVRVFADDGGGVLAVEDAGPGVPEELRGTIFQPFRRGRDETPYEGSGIGLSLVARFAELHGGQAWVQERPGGGASFRVFLPTAPADTATP
jgi:signal transduction histidine kinase